MLKAKKAVESTKKRFDQNRGDEEEWNSSRDSSPSPSSNKRQSSSRCEPDESLTHSPNENVRVPPSKKYYKKEASYPEPMDTDSPSTYPKHVIVPSPMESARQHSSVHRAAYHEHVAAQTPPSAVSGNIVTPVLSHESMPPGASMHGYDAPSYRAAYYPGVGRVDHYPSVAPYSPSDMDVGAGYAVSNNVHLRPKRWACDYCCVATFLTFEEACAHEQACPRRHDPFGRGAGVGRPGAQPHAYSTKTSGGLGALAYHATQELQLGAPIRGGSWAFHGRGPPPPSSSSEHPRYPSLSPRFQEFRLSGYEGRDEPVSPPSTKDRSKRMLLALAGDSDSLSDRQCYVRSEFVEVFTATEKDVAARHSKGAQKLAVGQVGIRCIHCAHMQPKDRAERAVCYPSSISRIYQTVADMQRFHFEQCQEIPDETRKIYKSLKTTRPRGVGSPQTYWIQSAKLLNLVDTEEGIRFGNGHGAEGV